jgi:hypothetical protein
MKRFWVSCLIVTCCIISLCATVWAISPSEKQQLDNFKVSTLKGLRSVAVTVKIIRDNDKTLELLNEYALQKDVEFILRDAGIEITAPTPEAGIYVVIVKVAATGRDNMYFAMHIQSSLSQIVQLTRDQSIKTEAQTWPAISQARFGVAPITVAKSTVEKTAKEQAANFVDDWKAANPKTKIEQQSTSLVWGEEVNGLQAAVEFVPESPSYKSGEKVGARFHIKNVSFLPINKFEKLGQHTNINLTVTDEQGNEVKRNIPIGWQESRPDYSYRIEPDKEYVLNCPGTDILAHIPNAVTERSVVTFKLDFDRKIILETGKRSIIIEPNNQP